MAVEIKTVLALDCETSGINFNNIDPSQNYQSVSWGLVVADAKTLKPIDKLYVEIKYNGTDKWTADAEKIHGLSKKHLEEHGLDEEDAVEKMCAFIHKHFGSKKAITLLGHNVSSFDVFFLKKLFKKYDVPLKLSSRCIDTFSVGFVTIGTNDSNELFETVCSSTRERHDALEDAELALEAMRKLKRLWKKFTG